MKKGSNHLNQHTNRGEEDAIQAIRSAAPGSAPKHSTTSQNSTSSSQMSGGATPVQGQNQSREKEQSDLRKF